MAKGFTAEIRRGSYKLAEVSVRSLHDESQRSGPGFEAVELQAQGSGTEPWISVAVISETGVQQLEPCDSLGIETQGHAERQAIHRSGANRSAQQIEAQWQALSYARLRGETDDPTHTSGDELREPRYAVCARNGKLVGPTIPAEVKQQPLCSR